MPIDEQALAKVADKVLAYRPRKIQMNLPVSQGSLFIERKVNGDMIPQRPRDGYINATALCKKAGKSFNDYSRLSSTQAFLSELHTETGIPVSVLIQTLKGGSDPKAQGTWVHPDIAIHLGQWLSPKFAVQVSRWGERGYTCSPQLQMRVATRAYCHTPCQSAANAATAI